MKSYPLIAAKVAKEMWCITPEVFDAIRAGLDGRAEGMPMPMPPTPDEPDDSQDAFSEGAVAVIPVFGILGKHLSQFEMMCGGASCDAISAQLSAAANNSEVSKIILAFHSPGGMVMGIPELAEKIDTISAIKPVIAFADGLCCSAALWLASSATAFYVTPSSSIGSVGCYSLLLDCSEKMAKDGVKVNAIVDGEFKLAGASFKPLTENERAMFQAKADQIGKDFREALTERRAIDAADMQGQVFSGIEATAKGFTDGLVSDLQECIEEARKISIG
jgi:ClpP class serine protease